MKFVSRDSLVRLVAQIKKVLLGKQDSDLVVVFDGTTGDKTFAEIAEAHNAGRRVFVALADAFLLPLTVWQDISAAFCITGDNLQVYVRVESNDTWSFEFKDLVGTDNIKTVNGESLIGSGDVAIDASNVLTTGNAPHGTWTSGESTEDALEALDSNKVGYKEYATISAMQADTTQPNGTIGFVSARHRFYIYHSLFEEWIMIAQGTQPSNTYFPYAFDIVLS